MRMRAAFQAGTAAATTPMTKAAAGWGAIAVLYVVIAAGTWGIYDDCFSEDDYNVICRMSSSVDLS